ncbi:ERV/ALR sulfhydryl oxidase domain-containing protein [Mycena galopus ATCC 62051]|nr:ERV/ALR sulfhydryl oxidase domain-containing protein [Mycena galopus ATCC 62051]
MISRFAKSFVAIVVALASSGTFLLLLSTVTFLHPPSRAYVDPWSGDLFGEGGMEQSLRTNQPHPNPPILGADGGVIMPKLGNATASPHYFKSNRTILSLLRAALGRATWKLLHTMTLRYPEDERDALSSYFHLLSRLYPCGECAAEFQMLLQKYPPQAMLVHNVVNKRLHKDEFDCAHLDDTYDCGCGDEPIGTTDPMDLGRDGDEGGMMRGGK